MAELFPITNPSISEPEKASVYEVFAKHQNAISLGKSDLGSVNKFYHSSGTDNAKPSHIPMRRVPYHSRHMGQKEVESMLKADVI